jgi:hypothetical protein|tara:strand:- start:21138 stop:21470 length:333 start_codon:yes stop_codon:yes gene_type:complete
MKDSLPKEIGIVDMMPCSSCESHMKKGIWLIEINPPKDGKIPMHEQTDRKGNVVQRIPNPDRTGRMALMIDPAVERIFDKGMYEWGRKHRFLFIDKETYEMVGLDQEVEA